MKKVLPIIKLASDFSNIKRTVGYRKGHIENDAEHSYQLALTSWFTNKQYNLSLNDELILKFALTHDLVELYAGDTDAYDTDRIIDKKKREEESFKNLKSEFNKFPELAETIKRYETKKDLESQLVYMMDKFLPDVNIHGYGGDYYGKRKITIDKWENWLNTKIDYKSLNEKLKPIFDEAVAETKKNFQSNFFKK